MIENLLTEALREKIAEAVKDFRLPVEYGEMRAPNVINGYLSPRDYTRKDVFPFVLVRAEEGSINVDKTQTTVAIIIGCYSNENDGEKYCLNVMRRIIQALSEMENGILANKYVLKHPMSWQIAEQPVNKWQLDMMTQWEYNTPQAIF